MLKITMFLATCVAIGCSIAIAVTYIRARNTPASNSCINNLRQLEGARQQWQLENHKSTNDVPQMVDLAPYLGRLPLVCPQGGTYTLGRDKAPSCTYPGHKLPD